MTEHRSVWLATAEGHEFAVLDRDLDVDLVVVGGGIVGLTTALLARRQGAEVALLDAATMGGGATGHSTGKVTSQHTLTYARLLDRFGHDKAQLYATANQRSIEQLASLAADLDIDCELTRAPAYAYTSDPEARATIESEVSAAQQLGLPAELTEDAELPFAVEAAARFTDQIHLHPGRYIAGLARALSAAGVAIYGHSRVIDVDGSSTGPVRVRTKAATVRASRAVLATLLPPGTIGGYFARTRPSRSYALAARLRTPAPPAMTISVDSPTRSTRPWIIPGAHGLIVAGNSHETGGGGDTEAVYLELEEWTRRTFDVEAVDYRWSAQDYSTPDGVPYVGRSALSERIFVATGFHKWGLSNGTAAATIVSDLVAGRDHAWLDVFDATRIGDPQAVVRLILDNLHVGKELVGGHLIRPRSGEVADLAPGRGGIVEVDGDHVGAYRDDGGSVHTVRPTCTHLGCRLHWNQAETTWDCSCHGSRFDVDGSIVEGPAVEALEPGPDAG